MSYEEIENLKKNQSRAPSPRHSLAADQHPAVICHLRTYRRGANGIPFQCGGDEDIVRRRFDAGLRNFKDIYMDLVDKWEWYDNSGKTPQMISEGAVGGNR